VSVEHTAEEIAFLVEREIDTTMNVSVKSALLAVRVPPRLQMRRWDYSLTRVLLPCWIVAEFRGTHLGLPYSPLGHGSRGDCWGVVELAGESFGRDDALTDVRGSGVGRSPSINQSIKSRG
jgi:hypothetical protein